MMNTIALRRPTELLDEALSELRRTRDHRRDLDHAPMPAEGSFAVPVELRETAADYLVRVEVPGIRRGRLSVTCDVRTLYISGARMDDDDGFARYSERSYGAFSREITLPAEIETDMAVVQYTDGVLEIRLPKAGEVHAHVAEERPEGA